MSFYPKFRKMSDGRLILGYTPEAGRLSKTDRPTSRCKEAATVHQGAVQQLRRLGGNPEDELQVLGQYVVQFGTFQGQTFLWMLENALGYVAWFVGIIRREPQFQTPLSQNKFALRRYVESFPDGRLAIQMKAMEPSMRPGGQPARRQPPATDVVAAAPTAASRATGDTKTKARKQLFPATRPLARIGDTTAAAPEMDDRALLSAVESMESSGLASKPTATAPTTFPTATTTRPSVVRVTVPPSTDSKPPVAVTAPPAQRAVPPKTVMPPPASSSLATFEQDLPLPEGWRLTLPKADQQWVSRAMFQYNAAGRAELDMSRVNRLWWHPPPPMTVAHQPPRMDRYYAQALLLWMPRRLWQVILRCQEPGCRGNELTSAGLYHRTRQVLDLDGYYNLATEYLECSLCKKKVIGWSSVVLSQLDPGHRLQFPVIMTYRYACDVKVVRLLRQRGLGNSATQLQKKLTEGHSEAWLRKTALYLTDCGAFTDAAASGLVSRPRFQEPPQLVPVPKFRWLLAVYCRDVLSRLDEVKASITSTFGRILKMDSTKKVVRKLAGQVAGTAAWCTNVGNEHGQVLNSVLTAAEGHGLEALAAGLVSRFQKAGAPAPALLYVDRDCCGSSPASGLFSSWPELQTRLDIWHFMRRFSAGCTTDSHPLYGAFMGRLSNAIFYWSPEDVKALKEAKRAVLLARGIEDPSDDAVYRTITRSELSKHCRRMTRGEEQTTAMISSLLETFRGDQGRDTTGVPLLDDARIQDIWNSQLRHVACIQDPDGVQLYTRVGSLSKGGFSLPVYRCARGSTSLESFHLHLNRFIPGTSASDLHFQAYLVEGLARWNEDRAAAIVEPSDNQEPQSYSSITRHAVNRMGQAVLGRTISPGYREPRKFTGELIGVEYLYSQTGQVLQDLKEEDPDDPEAEQSDEDQDEGFDEQEFDEDDPTVPSVQDVLLSGRPASPRRRVTSSPRSPRRTASRPILQLPRDSEVEDIPEPDPSVVEELARVRRRLDLGSSAAVTATATAATSTVLPTTQAPPTPVLEPGSDVTGTATPTSTGQDTMSSLDPEASVGPDSIEGFDRVETLATYVVSLRDQSRALSNAQADRIIALWTALHPYDQTATSFSPRHRSRLSTGRFKATKSSTTVTPGVDSTKRCFLGQNTGPAQWPDCNRYVEAIMVKLCELYPSPVKRHGSTITRWSQVIRAYKRIREAVLSNARVMANTGLQLVEVNNTTLTQWYNKRSKKQEKDVLQQGLDVPLGPSTAPPNKLPLPRLRPTSLPVVPVTERYQFQLAPNTAGTYAGRKRRLLPKPPTPSPSDPDSSDADEGECRPAEPVPQPPPAKRVPKSTMSYWRKRHAEEAEGKVRRKYTRRTTTMCRKCGKERDPAGHTQYFGNWYCRETSFLTLEEWRQAQAEKGYTSRKKKRKD